MHKVEIHVNDTLIFFNLRVVCDFRHFYFVNYAKVCLSSINVVQNDFLNNKSVAESHV